MSRLNWQNLRSWNGSQNSAFEELCCQLAANELVEAGSQFIRKGTPDGGVECFWILPNGDELGWQAKFFGSVEESQWSQLKNSVKKVLEKHPRLISYTICLPLDRPDARIATQKSLLEKWDEHVEEWKQLAKNAGRDINFIYWGEHEIFERLTHEKHRGRYFFWFNSEFFSQEWFQSRLDEAIANAGARYTPEINIDLPVAKLFEGLGRTKAFFDRFKVIKEKIFLQLSKINYPGTEHNVQELSKKLKNNISTLVQALEKLEKSNFDLLCSIEIAEIKRLVTTSINTADEYENSLRNIDDEEKAGKGRSSIRYKLDKLLTQLYELETLANSREMILSNIPSLLLLGEAGTGKTHLLCDVAKNRIKLGLPTVVLLGEQFNNSEPWSQIINILALDCKVDEFLGALDTAAQTKQSKALIFIDALNEGEGKKLWNKYFAGILTKLSKYPRIGITVSVRTPFEDVVIPEHLNSQTLVRECHHGFADHEYEATRTFFDFYKIQRPSVPLLNPEFQNPLFLKLFCKGLNDRELTEVPSGYYGITAVFSFLIDAVNLKLAKEENLNYDHRSEIVQNAMKKLAELMAKGNKRYLTIEEAQSVVNSFLPREGFHNSLYKHLLVEGLLSEDRFYQENNQWIDGTRFSYERFSDHLIVKYLLDEYLDIDNPSESFLPEHPLGELIYVEDSWINQNLIEALSIQLPEKIRKELADVAPSCAELDIVIDSFIKSLIWRDPTSITDETLQYISQYVCRHKHHENQLLEAFLTISTKPDHPFNANYLHKRFKMLDLADRDAWWSIFLHDQYGNHGAVDRLIEWAWSQEDKSYINDESIRLCAIVLTWFLTTSNRFLRDRSTKALVAILTPRIYLFNDLITQFIDVNDWYVLERLFAAAYGCVMRSNDNLSIAELAQNVYHWIFENGEPIPHILLRDYARGVIEVALYRQQSLNIDPSKIRPPYKSDWLSYIPSEEDLNEYIERLKQQSDGNEENMPYGYSKLSGLYSIKHSLGSSGDFARYVIGTNGGGFRWTSRRLNIPFTPSQKEIYENFLNSLTDRQKQKFEAYQETMRIIKYYQNLSSSEDKIIEFGREFTELELEEELENSENSFIKSLGKKKTKIYKDSVISYFKNPSIVENRFDLRIAQRWFFWRVLEMGYCVDYFNYFDSTVGRGATLRSPYKTERIGKKYQWLAYYEFLARVSDNFEFKKDNWIESDDNGYQGSWQISIRNIDPSCLLDGTSIDNNQNSLTGWWSQKYDEWTSGIDMTSWLYDTNNLPSPEACIDVTNPEDNSRWLTLESLTQWSNSITEATGKNNEFFPEQELFYIIRSYIVRKDYIDCLYEWAIQQNFMETEMPKSSEQIHINLGEFFWSDAFKYHNIPYFHHDGWTEVMEDKIPHKILVTTDKYYAETGTFDCSIQQTYQIYLPCQWLVENMNLQWNGKEGKFFNKQGELIAFDPSVYEAGSNACLIRYDALLSFLEDKGYDILWTVLGEKNVMNSVSANGRLELSGAFRMQDGQLTGKINYHQDVY